MQSRQAYAGLFSMALAIVLLLLDLDRIDIFGVQTSVAIYPAAFFGLAGIVLLYRAYKAQMSS